jgi:uncharacterized RDD family membrane protein YckC
LSTSLSQPTLESAWKQEVNLRVAAHRNRRNLSAVEAPAPAAVRPGPGSRAAEAAARVAARYAKAPSYSQMQAAEARVAMREAEIATQVAMEAQAAAQVAFAGFQAAVADQFHWETAAAPAPEPIQMPAERWQAEEPAQAPIPVSRRADERPSPQIQWEPDFPHRQPQPTASQMERQAEAHAADGWGYLPAVNENETAGQYEPVEPVMPIHANLIEFPRELVAPRKARPRLAETPQAAVETERQLSIFEVDPGAISLEPEFAATAARVAEQPWSAPEWSGIELEAQPQPAAEAAQEAPAARVDLQLAPMGHRLLAAVVDGLLITSAFLLAAVVAASNMAQLPAARVLETSAGIALLLIGALYQGLFLTLADATPGMKYARLSLCTFENRRPDREQLRLRLGALMLSLLPVGLGVAWAVFDEDHLSWHDRLSGTYLRKC